MLYWRNLRLASLDDVPTASLGMALFALCAGYAVHLSEGYYSPHALFWLTIAFGFCVLAMALPLWPRLESGSWRSLPLVLAFGALGQGAALLARAKFEPQNALEVDTLQAEGFMRNHHFS